MMKLRTLITMSAVVMTACGSQTPQQKAAAEPIQVPEVYRVKFETTRGVFVVEVTRAWAPRGADRFYELIQKKFYEGARFFRVVPNFVVQFGLKGDPTADRYWSQMNIPDDPVKKNNSRGTLTFAMAGPATRTTQIFINLQDNYALDSQGFAPFAKVVSGMNIVNQLYRGYGDGPPGGQGPEQGRIRTEGNPYLERYFSKLDYIKAATIE